MDISVFPAHVLRVHFQHILCTLNLLALIASNIKILCLLKLFFDVNLKQKRKIHTQCYSSSLSRVT